MGDQEKIKLSANFFLILLLIIPLQGNCGLSVGVSACVCGGGKEWKKREKHGWCQEEGVACGGGGGAVWKVHKAYGGGEAYRSLYKGILNMCPIFSPIQACVAY